MRGLYWEEWEIGAEFESPARTVTEADIVMYAGLSGDYNPLHINEEYAKQTQFGGRIAHGPLVYGIAPGLLFDELEMDAMQDQLQKPALVPPPDRTASP